MPTLSITTLKGLAFGRFAKALLISKGDPMGAIGYAMGQRWHDTPLVVEALKAVITPMATTDDSPATLASPIAFDFAEVLRPMTLIGRMQGMRRVPFNTRTIVQATGAAASWVGEGAPISAFAGDFDTGTTLQWAKVASLSVHTNELARSSAPGVEMILTADAARAAAYAIDQSFVGPDNSGVAGIKPASVTNGATTIASTGSAVANVDADLRAALAVLNNASIDLATAYWLMPPRTAVYLATLRGTGGAAAYPLMTVKGGSLLGLPVLTSSACLDESSPTEAIIALVAADEVLLADDGQSSVEISTEASIQLDSAPQAGAQSLTSLWQHNLAGLKATRFVNWQRRRSAAVAVISQVQF